MITAKITGFRPLATGTNGKKYFTVFLTDVETGKRYKIYPCPEFANFHLWDELCRVGNVLTGLVAKMEGGDVLNADFAPYLLRYEEPKAKIEPEDLQRKLL